MSTTNDRATSGTSGVKPRSQELQYTSGAQRRSDTPAYEDVESEIRKQLQKFSSSLLEAMHPIKDLVVEVGKPAGYLVTVPEIHSIVGDLQRTIARVESSIVPNMALDGALQPKFTYPNLVVQLEEIKSQITQAGQRFQAILQAPKHRPPRRWFRGKGWRPQIKDLKELHARVKDATSTLELLVAAITMTAALEQRNFRGTQKLNSINEALRNSLPPGHILLEEETTVSQPAQQSPGQPVLRKGLVRRTKAAFLADRRFDDFYHSNISIPDRARHKYFLKERLEGTCDWFFGQKPWGEWVSSSTCGTPSTLYCWGPPGIGKSTITSLVIDELANANRVRAFCYLGDCGVSSAESLVLSLGSQLWKSYSEVVPHDSGVYGSDHGSHISIEGAAEMERNVRVRASTEKDLVLYPTNDAEMPTGALPDAPVPMSLHAKPQATFNVLLDALIQLIRGFNGEDRKVFIVIDAWEKERMEPGREHDFDALLTGVQSVGCRVFLTSRTKPHNTLQASEFVSLPIEESDVHRDTENLIQVRMNDMFAEYFRIPTAPKLRIPIDLTQIKGLLGSFTLANLFLRYIRAVISRSKELWWRTLYTLTARPLVGASTPCPLLIRLSKSDWFETGRLIRASIEILTREPSSVQQKSILVLLTFADTPLLLDDIGGALRNISKPVGTFNHPDSSPLGPKESDDLMAMLIQLDGLIVWDRGNQLVRLASDQVRISVKSLWFSAYESNTIVPWESGISLLGSICLYCMYYILDVHLQGTTLQYEITANELLQKHKFLSYAVTSWTKYCREFYKSIDKSIVHQELSTPFINQAGFERHYGAGDVPDLTGLDEGNDQHYAPLGLEEVGLAVEAPRNRLQDRSAYLMSLRIEISIRISELVRDRSKLFMVVLLALYLSPDSPSQDMSWEEHYSWVTSMSELLMVSCLGLDYVIKRTLKSDPDQLSQRDKYGNTPLHAAAKFGFRDVVLTLLSAGASVTVENQAKKTPADYAHDLGHNQTFVLIFEHMAIRGAVGNNSILVNRYCKCIAAEQGDEKRCVDLTLLYAIQTSKTAVTRCLLENGADPNGFNDENTPILHCAIRYGEESLGNFSYLQNSGFDLLLRYGADPDIQSKDSKQESALHVAVRWGKLGFIRFLLRYGMDPRSADSEGRPPLFAIFDRSFDYDNYDCLEIISHLVSRGADPNQQDNEGRRALHLAAQKGSRKVMELLIRLGAACDQPDATGKLPLDYARETNDHASIGLLESYISSHTLEPEC